MTSLVTLGMSTDVRADEGARVVVLELPDASERVQEALVRLRAELRAEGFDVVVEPGTEGTEAELLQQAARRHAATAAISIASLDSLEQADVWVLDRVTNKTLIRTVDVGDIEPAERPRVLALRAVDLLRASLLEALAPPPVEHREPMPSLPPEVQAWVAPEVPNPFQGVHLEWGVAALASLDRLGVGGGPMMRIGYGGSFGLSGRVSFSGPLFGARADSPFGSGAVRQEIIALELVYAPDPDWGGIVPTASVGLGAYHLMVQGEPAPPLQGAEADVWAVAGSVGVGLGYRLTKRFMLFLDGMMLVTAPRTVVTAFGDPVGSAGRPSLLLGLGTLARL